MGTPQGRRPQGYPPTSTPPPDDYRLPLLPQRYPPLGYTANGTPLFAPGDDARESQQAGRPPGALTPNPGQGSSSSTAGESGSGVTGGSPGGQGSGNGGSRDSNSSTRRMITAGVIALAACLAITLVVAIVGQLRERSSATQLPATLTVPDLPTITAPPTITGAPSEPGDPAGPGGGQVPTGQEVSYAVTIDGSGTILYVDDLGVQTEFAPPPRWSVTFTAGRNPLRLVVVAGQGSAAECTITVAGRPVVTDSISAEATRRTATCIA